MHLPFLRKSKNDCFNTSNGLKPSLSQYCFALAILQLSQPRSGFKIEIPRLQQRPAWYVKRIAFFLLVGAKYRCIRVPSQVCCGKVALSRARLRVGACTDRLLSPCHHQPVSSSTNLFGWTVHGGFTASNGANTTKMRSQQGQEDQANQRAGLNHLGRYGSHFFCERGCPKDEKTL